MKIIRDFFAMLLIAAIYDFVPMVLLMFLISFISESHVVSLFSTRTIGIVISSTLFLFTFFSVTQNKSEKDKEKYEKHIKGQIDEKEVELNKTWKQKEYEFSLQQHWIRQQFDAIKKQREQLSNQQQALSNQQQEIEKRVKNIDKEVNAAALEQVGKLVNSVSPQMLFSKTAVFNDFAHISPIAVNRKLLAAKTERAMIHYPLSVSADIQGKEAIYHVSLNSCSCPDFQFRHTPCKHMYKLALAVGLMSSVPKSEADIAFSHLVNERTALQKAQQELEQNNRRLSVQMKSIAKHGSSLKRLLSSNLESIPWLAGMMADYLTYDLEIEAQKLDWGNNVRRQEKVASIREIRACAEKRIAEAKEAQYQLEYLRRLFPALDEVLETDYAELNTPSSDDFLDPVSNYLTRKEWNDLSQSERNQLALDRYIASHKKSKWQIGRDYELSVAYELMQSGYSVETTGSFHGLEDMGRDLIAWRDGKCKIVQCKYWSQDKSIHEKHIYQLYGSIVSFCIENNLRLEFIKGTIVTNTKLSPVAQKAAKYLKIDVKENHAMVDFPRIKCNVGRNEYGETKIYHLPMDDQYDRVKIEKPGEFWAFTVQEAEARGFRRAYRWHGNHTN